MIPALTRIDWCRTTPCSLHRPTYRVDINIYNGGNTLQAHRGSIRKGRAVRLPDVKTIPWSMWLLKMQQRMQNGQVSGCLRKPSGSMPQKEERISMRYIIGETP